MKNPFISFLRKAGILAVVFALAFPVHANEDIDACMQNKWCRGEYIKERKKRDPSYRPSYRPPSSGYTLRGRTQRFLLSQIFKDVSYGNLSEVKRLIKAGANVNAVNNFGKTVLMVATDIGHYEIAEVLLAAGADVNTADNHGLTALMYAVLSGNIGGAKVLLNAGANPNQINNVGGTALDLAYRQDNPNELIALLKEAEAKATREKEEAEQAKWTMQLIGILLILAFGGAMYFMRKKRQGAKE